MLALCVISPPAYLEGSDARVAVVDGGGQQALPALRVIFVGQLAGS